MAGMSETLAPVSMSANTCIYMSVTEERRKKNGFEFFENVKLWNYGDYTMKIWNNDEIPTFLMYWRT